MSNKKSEGNLYDKIFKENASTTFIPLIERELGVKIKKYTPLEADMQRTRELKKDFFYRVQPEKGEPFILHLEFQVEDDHDMIYRMAEYWAMASRKWRLDVEQFVIFMGKKPSTMQHKLKKPYTGFTLLNICEFSSEKMLSSQTPELIILAVLGDFPAEQAESILRRILEQLERCSKNKNLLSRYFNQLLVLANLRNLEPLVLQIISDMPMIFNIETSQVYQLGTEKGVAEGKEIGEEIGKEIGKEINKVKNNFKTISLKKELKLSISDLTRLTDFSEKKILEIEKALEKFDLPALAKITNLPEENIQEILAELKEEGS